MSDLNRAMLIGRLGNDPEVKYLQNGTAVASFSIATTSKWKDRDGNLQERTEWHRITAWSRLAEIVGEYAQKGRQVYVEGEIRYEKYEQDGVEKYSTKIIADKVQLLGANPNREDGPAEDRPQRQQQGGGQRSQGSGQRQQQGARSGGSAQQGAPAPRNDEPFPDDDIPF